MNEKTYRKKLQGAIIGRFSGCALGAPVELMSYDDLHYFVSTIKGQPFPPTDYFLKAPHPDDQRYLIGKGRDFTKDEMICLSTDDDIAYTLLSLMMLEKHGDKLKTKHVASFWQTYLPLECTFTAERTTLKNLNNGITPELAATIDNDEDEYIGAAIRIDGYGYIHPGDPKKAAALAYQDAFLSHRHAGIHSAMFFAALIALAFESNDIISSMEEALDFIPRSSKFYQEIHWALSMLKNVHSYKDAHRLVMERFKNMSWVHAINNACLCVFGIYLGQDDFDKGIGETVAMAYDNDCTAATVGSVLGAYLGIDAIDKKWYKPWNNHILSYLHGIDSFALDDVIERYFQIGVTNL